MSGGVPAGDAHDPDTPAYEAARLTIVAELRRIAVYEPKSGYREMADRLMKGEQYEIPSWLAMVLLARATPTPPIEGRDADVERVSKAIYDAVEPLSGDPIAVVLHNSDHLFWDDRLPGDTDVERQLAAVRIICDTAARAALQALGERG